jgi:hypothetical protein
MNNLPKIKCTICLLEVGIESSSLDFKQAKSYVGMYGAVPLYCKICMKKHTIIVANWECQNYLQGYLTDWVPILYSISGLHFPESVIPVLDTGIHLELSLTGPQCQALG